MIVDTVGLNGANGKKDVRVIQTLINARADLRPNEADLILDGIYGPTTQAAIDAVLKSLGLNTAGLIEPSKDALLQLWPIAYANPTGMGIRGSDAKGSGHYGASRRGGTRKHNGVDYIVTVGQKVTAPMSGYVKRIANPYSMIRITKSSLA